MTDSSESQLAKVLDAAFLFEAQPDPISPSLRPELRIPLVLILVAKSRGTGASWKGLQLLSWAIRDKKNTELLVALRNGSEIPDRPVVRFEPALDRALDLAVGLGFLEERAVRVYKLTESGKSLVSQVNRAGVFIQERRLLEQLHGKISQTDISRILEWRLG